MSESTATPDKLPENPPIPVFDRADRPPRWVRPPEGWRGAEIGTQEEANQQLYHLLNRPRRKRPRSPLFHVVVRPSEAIDLTCIPTRSWSYGHVDVMSGYLCGDEPDAMYKWPEEIRKPAGQWKRGPFGIDWLIVVGGESPVHPDWVRSLRDQAVAAGVPFAFAGWGVWVPLSESGATHYNPWTLKEGKIIGGPLDGSVVPVGYFEGNVDMLNVGPEHSGRTLDGRTWEERPEGLAGMNESEARP